MSDALSDALPPKVREAISGALQAALMHDGERVSESIDVLMRHGHYAVYAACLVWANTVTQFSINPARAAGGPDSDAAFVGLRVVDYTGDQPRLMEPEQAPPDVAPAVWAGRFITAFANDDPASALALYRAADPAQIGEGAYCLLMSAAGSMASAAGVED